MTLKNFSACAVLFTLAILVQAAHAESSVWKISKGENYFYLGGTIHVLSLADYPLPDEFTTAYGDASTLIFETDMAEVQSAEYQAAYSAALNYTDGRTLSDELDPETYDRLENFLESRYIPIAGFSTTRPWGVSMIIAVLEYQRLGMEPQYGVDSFFYNLAQSERKRTLGLETMEEQLNAIKSMGKVDPDSIIEYTLRDVKQLPEFARTMKAAWRNGHVEVFSTDPMSVQMKTDYPEIYDALITKRNHAWMQTLATLTNDDTREFVLVGAMHLGGEEGLLKQLKALGFSVEQL